MSADLLIDNPFGVSLRRIILSGDDDEPLKVELIMHILFCASVVVAAMPTHVSEPQSLGNEYVKLVITIR